MKLNKFTLEPKSDSDILLSDTLMAWDAFVKREDPTDLIVDFNISGYKTNKTYDNTDQIYGDIETLLADKDIQNCPLTMGTVISLKEHFLSRTAPEAIDISTHHLKTIGFKPKILDEHFILSLRDDFQAVCALYDYDTSDFEKFMQDNDRIIQAGNIAKEMGNELAKQRGRLETLMGKPSNFTLNSSIQNRPNDFWYMWIDGTKRDFNVIINEHFYPKGISEADLLLTTRHELCGHAIYYGYMNDALEAGERPIHSGLTTVFGSEVFVSEGIADIMPLYLNGGEYPMLTANNAYMTYRRGILNNVCALMFTEGEEAARNYSKKHADNSTIKRLDGLMSSLNQPINRTYLPVYGAEHILFSTALKALSTADFEDVLKTSYLEYLCPADVNALMKEKGVPEYALVDTSGSHLTL